ncbi:MAG: hypothetical protein ACWGOX_06385 [Desulforhopalus sp.]
MPERNALLFSGSRVSRVAAGKPVPVRREYPAVSGRVGSQEDAK